MNVHTNRTDHAALYKTAQNTADTVPDILVKAEKAANLITQGGHAKRVHGMGDLFWQYTPYTPDQDAKRIDWRQSAKSDHLYIREKERHNAQNYAFWVSGAQSMSFKSDKTRMTKSDMAQCLSLALSVILTRNHETIGALGQKPFGYTQTATRKLFSHFQQNTESLPKPKTRIKKNTTCILSGDFLSPIKDIKQSLAPIAAQTQNGILFHVFDPAEIALPYKGRIRFQNQTEQSKQALINHTQDIRKEYMQRLQNHCKYIEDLCTAYGWHYIRHQTDTNIADTLIKTLMHFNHKRSHP